MARFRVAMPRVPIAELGRTVAFSTGTLGCRAGVLWPEGRPTFAILDRDGIRLGFFLPDEHYPDAAPGSCDLWIEVEDTVGLHATLKDAIPIEWGPEVYFCGRRGFAIRDPDGTLLIFSEETSDPPTCPEG